MQTGVQNPKENVLLQLIVQLISEPAFNQLRTNEQLGFIFLNSFFFGCNRIALSYAGSLRLFKKRSNFFLKKFFQLKSVVLGYIVHTNVFCNFGVQALRMIVQGGHDPEFVNERIECFLSTFRVCFFII